MDKDLAWSVAMTKPRQESYAQARLAEQDFATYLPMVAKRDKLGRQIGTMPMFPGYCFCGYVAEQSIAPIRSTPGVISLVRFGMEIAVVQPAVVERVRRAEAALQANAAAGALKPGDRASRVSAERIDVLMTIMGQPQRIRFSPGHLARPV
jgi:transcriptional antiterminator RfaH